MKTIRWTVTNAGAEFGLSPKTLSARIKARGILAGEDGRFSTRQICQAVFSDLQLEKTRLCKEQANLTEMSRKAREAELLPAKQVEWVWKDICAGMVQIINQSGLSLKDQAELRKLLHNLPVERYCADADRRWADLQRKENA